MASKVPKFGAWEGGDENYTVYFDKARDSKHSGKKINPNDPEENPDMFRPNGGSAQAQPHQTRGDKPRKQTNVPQFGAWENEETIGFTQCFENVRKGKHGGPTAADHEPQMNRDMPSHPGPSGRTQTQAQSQAKALAQAHAQALAEAQVKAQARARPASREARPNVPRFGDWEGETGGGYTVVFDNLKKKHNPYSNAPQPSRDLGPTPQEGRAKAPKFGDWEEGEAVQYTEYFNPRKTNNLRPGQNPTEPQMNRDVSQGSPLVSREGQGRPGLVAQPTVHPKANLQPRTTDNRGNQAASIPHFGDWNNDPSQAEGYTGVFTRAKEERQTPVHHNVIPHHQPHLYNKQKQQPSCCTIL